jgi:predicted ester cyclase
MWLIVQIGNWEFFGNFAVSDSSISKPTIRKQRRCHRRPQLLGLPATGNIVSFTGMGFYRFNEAGLIVEHWHEMDVLALTRQLS